ncbi:hypothetical protein [Cellulomonas denverensis]|uniref:RAMA domain-containing protein n=1 Tax=Cellulomonas denverensis TaxID=264297 RepID=A0A7X6KSP3_9CELL|nr:hypothetical protein [Cellulomonas denverensis]NKY21567.1 hypothetical protein [Cellulomonas denverensis]GIG25458.1 hypothetical protein Cde04nite_17020 [Cellulomonas denverensis]
MAIFELDDGHGTLVQPMRPSADSFDRDAAALVAENAGELIGEPVLTIREIGAGDGSQLLALDAAAQPVVVEAVQLLDASTLLRALRHAGGAARMSRADIARLYRGGPEAFEADLAVFRDRAPMVRAERAGREGVRLVLVCGDIAEGLQEAVEYLTAGTQVDVLRLGVTEGPGGRRYLDVSPLRPGSTRQRRPVEPGPATGSVPAVSQAPTPWPPTGAAPAEPEEQTEPEEPQAEPEEPPVDAVAEPEPTFSPAAIPVDPVPLTRRSRRGDAAEVPTPLTGPRPIAADATTVLPPVRDDSAPVPGGPLPELAALAAAERKPLDLVWVRVRRGQRLTATLRTDGMIQLADGSLHTDPGDAAVVAADLERPADGWRVWRFGEDGPSLGEAVGIR